MTQQLTYEEVAEELPPCLMGIVESYDLSTSIALGKCMNQLTTFRILLCVGCNYITLGHPDGELHCTCSYDLLYMGTEKKVLNTINDLYNCVQYRGRGKICTVIWKFFFRMFADNKGYKFYLK